jgi:hypothetical protein
LCPETVTFKVFPELSSIVGIYPFMSKPAFEELFEGYCAMLAMVSRFGPQKTQQLPGIRGQNGKVDVQFIVQHLMRAI